MGKLQPQEQREDELEHLERGPLREMDLRPVDVRMEPPNRHLHVRLSLLHEAPPEWRFVQLQGLEQVHDSKCSELLGAQVRLRLPAMSHGHLLKPQAVQRLCLELERVPWGA